MRFLHSKRGASLIEAMMASFLLLTSILMSVYIFDGTLRASAASENRVIAAVVAESALAEIRDHANNQFTTVQATYDGLSWNLPDHPEFDVTARVDRAQLAIPCSELESQYPGDAAFPDPTGRYMNDSAWQAEVTVSWRGGHSLRMVERVANLHPSANFRVELLDGGTPPPSSTVISLARNAQRDFSARAFLGFQPVQDIQFRWYVEPLTGFGSIERVSRDGEQCRYRNAYRNYRNRLKYAPGTCRLVVVATYQGQEAQSLVLIENED